MLQYYVTIEIHTCIHTYAFIRNSRFLLNYYAVVDIVIRRVSCLYIFKGPIALSGLDPAGLLYMCE